MAENLAGETAVDIRGPETSKSEFREFVFEMSKTVTDDPKFGGNFIKCFHLGGRFVSLVVFCAKVSVLYPK